MNASDTTIKNQQTFEQWAIVELMGHQKMSGLVTEQNIAGKGFIRVDVYDEAGESVMLTRFINPDSIYAINPVERSIALAMTARTHRPVQEYEVRSILPPARTSTVEHDVGPGYDDDEVELWASDDDWDDDEEERIEDVIG